MQKKANRIAILGLALESNAFAPTTYRSDFDNYCLLRDKAIIDFIDGLGFAGKLNSLCKWQPVPVLYAAAESGGPLDHRDYLELVTEIESGLADSLPLDGVFIFAHGAGATTVLDDMDGDYFARVRQIVGPDVPVVAELDLHANLSEMMINAVDVLVGYRTNPHVDVAERAQECATLLFELLSGRRITVAWERLPLITAQNAQLTNTGSPCAELFAYAERHLSDHRLANITLLPGFSLGDSKNNGFAVCVSTWDDARFAASICDALAYEVWKNRTRFIRRSMSIAEAVSNERSLARANGMQLPRIYADIADNPGGGGRGNSIHLLRALHESGIKSLVAGVFYDPPLVAAAYNAGESVIIEARFNTNERVSSSGIWCIKAKVETLFEGSFHNSRGVGAGQLIHLGRACVLSIAGGETRIVVASLRNQVLSSDFFEIAGIDVNEASAVVVKSRGHFRAGFDHVTDSRHIHEVDGPGLTTCDLQSVAWRRLPRPVYPIDDCVQWQPRAKLKGAGQTA